MKTVLGVLVVLAACIGCCGAICVVDNKYGWSIDCGIRDSYLFRIKDYGGIKANFDFGIGFGDEDGFPQSIRNTAGGHYRKNDNTARSSSQNGTSAIRSDDHQTPGAAAERRQDSNASRPPPRRWARPGPAFRLLPPPPPGNRRQGNARPYRRQWSQNSLRRQNRPGGFRQSQRRPPPRAPLRVPVQGLHRAPPPGAKLFAVSVPFRNSGQSPVFLQPGQGHEQNKPKQFFVGHNQQAPQFLSQDPPPFRPPPPFTSSHAGTVGPILGEVLKINADTPADTDHVPSFAAKTFVVREAPAEFHPPGYSPTPSPPPASDHVEVPRTKFFCEEQKYLPGIYADAQLGCKVFHLCLPAAMGNTLTSFLCPNMTLFDQSILQCNWWYYVNCENSQHHYDANLPMALSYRKINAAQLPLSGVGNFGSVSLLSHNAGEFKNPQPAETEGNTNIAFNRIGKAVDTVEEVGQGDGIPREPRMMDGDGGDDGSDNEEGVDNSESGVDADNGEKDKIIKKTKEGENESDKVIKHTNTPKVKGEENIDHQVNKTITNVKEENIDQPEETHIINDNDETEPKEDKHTKKITDQDDKGDRERESNKENTEKTRRRRTIDLGKRLGIPPLISRLYNQEINVA
ncbi:uncharacterized protein LOC121869032 isoform X1 [Homarus americanus]|nr:uncharacterized protein LOC121869032 isoform X1 [Homarus americanus]